MSCPNCIRLNLTLYFFFFLNAPPPPEFSPFPLHAALPISLRRRQLLQDRFQQLPMVAGRNLLLVGVRRGPLGRRLVVVVFPAHFGKEPPARPVTREMIQTDRKSTRLNSSHSQISYAVFCLK